MAGSFSNFLENELLDHVFGAAAYTAPGTVYFAAYTAAPSDAGGGTEVSGGSYGRFSITNNATAFPAAASGSKTNGEPITWPEATANWGTVVGIAIFDAPTGGNMLAWCDFTGVAINTGDVLEVAAGDLTITLD